MAKFTANGIPLEADLLVFDKDGLMFDSSVFWRELASTRAEVIARQFGDETLALRWARLFGADTRFESGKAVTASVDSLGTMAVASPYEERTITSGMLCEKFGLKWHEARELGIRIFETADRALDLKKAIRPQPGYIDLMRRLIELDVPYCVATSDTLERTRDSMALFGFFDKVRCVITPEDVSEGKPAPDMLQLISRRLNVDPGRIAMIGDSYVDVRMASNAGCIGIGVNADKKMQTAMKPCATAILDDLHQLVF